MVTQGKTAISANSAHPTGLPAVKICGVRRADDAAHCLTLGVAYVGFNFYAGSSRLIEPAAAAAVWSEALTAVAPAHRGRTRAAGVFVNPTAAEVSHAVRVFPQLQVLQFHGDESPETLQELAAAAAGQAIWKALGVQSAADVAAARAFASSASLVLLDAPGGGTGRRFGWDLLAGIGGDQDFGIAGGLRPGAGLMAELKRLLGARRPALIDVCSGVELAPGRKDAALVRALVEEVRQAFSPAADGGAP